MYAVKYSLVYSYSVLCLELVFEPFINFEFGLLHIVQKFVVVFGRVHNNWVISIHLIFDYTTDRIYREFGCRLYSEPWAIPFGVILHSLSTTLILTTFRFVPTLSSSQLVYKFCISIQLIRRYDSLNISMLRKLWNWYEKNA